MSVLEKIKMSLLIHFCVKVSDRMEEDDVEPRCSDVLKLVQDSIDQSAITFSADSKLTEICCSRTGFDYETQ